MDLYLEAPDQVIGAPGDGVAFRDGAICARDGALRRIDCRGFTVAPGLVDLHGDGFERHLAPRRGAVRDLGAALASVEAELASNGITTAVLAQFWSWEGGMRGPEFARALASALGQARGGLHVQMRMQLRVETHLETGFEPVEAFIREAGIGYVVLNDHLPHAALEAGRRPPRLTGQALKAGRSPEAHLASLKSLHALGPQVADALPGFCARLAAAGVRLGSHDDATPEQREKLRAMGVRVAEFPETEATARAAHAAGDRVVLGAPNVMRGGSHKSGLAAEGMVEQGICDALVSDYHYPSLIQAAFRLMDDGMAAEHAWDLVSARPAEVLGLSDRGILRPGARADIVVLHTASRRVVATFACGKVAYAAGAFAERLMDAR